MNSNDIFFFGAGFSKSLISSYPTLTELSRYFLDNNFIYENEKIYKDNLEQLLTYLITPLPFKTKEDILRDEASYIEKIDKINNYFMKLRGNTTIDQNNKNILILSKYINENRCTCITLNYDLLLEEMLFLTHEESYQNVNSYDVFYKMPIINIAKRGNQEYNASIGNKIEDYFKKKSSELLKIHGSINWFCDNKISNSQIYFDEQMVGHNLNKMNNSSGVVILGAALKPDIDYINQLKIDLSPLIIPPILDKTNNYNHILLQSLWRKAFEAIQKAKNIYIYGFSFPMTDLSVVYLFQSALRLNENDYKIYIVNTESNIENKKKRYNEIFSEGKCDFSFCCSDNLEKLAEHLNKRLSENI
ncbi:SIR2 family protein [Campylobacter jejuni]|nr:SIR2 family protein [Campylobacter jejuni]